MYLRLYLFAPFDFIINCVIDYKVRVGSQRNCCVIKWMSTQSSYWLVNVQVLNLVLLTTGYEDL